MEHNLNATLVGRSLKFPATKRAISWQAVPLQKANRRLAVTMKSTTRVPPEPHWINHCESAIDCHPWLVIIANIDILYDVGV